MVLPPENSSFTNQDEGRPAVGGHPANSLHLQTTNPKSLLSSGGGQRTTETTRPNTVAKNSGAVVIDLGRALIGKER